MAVGCGDLGLRGRRSGRRQPVGPRSRARAIRSAGDLTHLVARSPDRETRVNDLRAADAARQALPLWRAHRGNADRAQERHRDRVELPCEADQSRRSAAGLWGSCKVPSEAQPISPSTGLRLRPLSRMVGTGPATTTEVQTIAMSAFILHLGDLFTGDPARV